MTNNKRTFSVGRLAQVWYQQVFNLLVTESHPDKCGMAVHTIDQQNDKSLNMPSLERKCIKDQEVSYL